MSDKYSDRSRVVKTIFIVVGVLFVGRLAMLQLFESSQGLKIDTAKGGI